MDVKYFRKVCMYFFFMKTITCKKNELQLVVKCKVQINRIIPIFLVFTGVLVILLVKHCFSGSTHEKELLDVAYEINSSCPVMIDEDTRLDSACVFPNKTLQYKYTMVKVLKDSIDIPILHANLESAILNSVKTNPELKFYRDNNVTMIYYYQDKIGRLVTIIKITPDQYRDLKEE